MPKDPNILIRFWQELKRRKVFKVLAMYAGTAFIIIQLESSLADPLNLVRWVGTLLVILLCAGFPVTAILAWIFDLTPQGIKKTESIEELAGKEIVTPPARRRLKASDVVIAVMAITIIILLWPKIFKQNALDRLKSSGEKLSVAVMPFQNMTNDTNWNKWQEGIQQRLISFLANTGELQIRQIDNIRNLLQEQGVTEFASFLPSVAGKVSDKLNADIYIYGSIQQAGQRISLDAQLPDTKTGEIIKSFEVSGPFKDEIVFDITDSLRKKVTDFLIMSKLMKGEEWFKHNMFTPPNSSEALRYFIYGKNARAKGDKSGAEKWYIKALDVDSNFTAAAFNLENIYAYDGKPEESLKWLVKDYEARGRMSYSDQIYASWAYACTFESPEKQIEYLNQWKEIDDQNLNSYWLLGLIYYTIEQYNKAIPELIKCSEISYNWYGKESYKDLSNYGYLGLAYHKTGQYKKEKKLWKFAERYIPENPWIITGKAVLAFSENDAVAAKKEIDRYISYGKKNSFTEADIASGVGDIYLNAGMVDKAETYYRKALSLDPGNTGKMNYLADFFIKTNRNLTEVPELMDKVMASAKNKVDYYRYLNKKGWAIYKQGKNQEALEILQRAWDEAPFKEFIIKSRLEEVKKAVAGGPSVKK